jgi:hypothetical protein
MPGIPAPFHQQAEDIGTFLAEDRASGAFRVESPARRDARRNLRDARRYVRDARRYVPEQPQEGPSENAD